MEDYSVAVEGQMVRFYRSLKEGDRRRYAAVEAVKLGHGGIEYVSRLLGCDPKTIGRGISELESEDQLATDGQRKKGADESR
mgnify:CR=1 FL=1